MTTLIFPNPELQAPLFTDAGSTQVSDFITGIQKLPEELRAQMPGNPLKFLSQLAQEPGTSPATDKGPSKPTGRGRS